MVTIYHFEVFDIYQVSYIVRPNKATLEHIEEAKGRIVPHTAEEVSLADVDRFGRYVPKTAEK